MFDLPVVSRLRRYSLRTWNDENLTRSGLLFITEETSISRINHVLLPFYVHVGKIRDSLNKTKGSSIENASKA